MTSITDIENMTAAEIKGSRAELIAGLTGVDCADRYVQARLDAKQRDEKLAVQAESISELEATLSRRVQAENAKQAEKLREKAVAVIVERDEARVERDALRLEVEELTARIDSLSEPDD